MENKINIAELLKDCPKGMELYSPLCGNCTLYDINEHCIRVESLDKSVVLSVTHYGRCHNDGEVIIFPKGKTTWEGFQKPFKSVKNITTDEIKSFKPNNNMSKEINLKIDENLITPEVKEFAKITQECIKEFPKIAQECVELYAKKNADYGNSFDVNMDKFGDVVATIRIGDKYSRLEQLTKPNNKANIKDESIDDTLIDLACYAIMTLSYRRRNKINVESNKN